jgi:5-(carboxyamino)imidazole ribonucleotide mutase
MKVLVIFGSGSNSPIYSKICEKLKEKKIDFELRICSAHKTPDMLDSILKNKYDLIIAGAGLAAHLPGVIASKTLTPVIGIPCDDNLSGIDALLSIIQMPPGIPVLSTGIDGRDTDFSLLLKEYRKVNVIAQKGTKKADKCTEILERFGVPYSLSDKIDEKSLNIRFIDMEKEPKEEKGMIINVPVKKETSGTDALKLLDMTRDSDFWVGIGRYENAALFAVQLMNKKGEYTQKLQDYRKEIAQKVIDADKGAK